MYNIKKCFLAVIMLVMCNALFADDQQNGQIGLDIAHDKVDILKAAIESNKLDPNHINGSKISPLGLAIENNSSKCIDYLLSLPSININSTYYVIYEGGDGSVSNQNALYTAVKNGNIKVANKLLDMGAEADFLSTDASANGDFQSDMTTLIYSILLKKSPEALKLSQRIADNTKQVNRIFSYNSTPAQRRLLLPTVSLLYRLITEGLEDHSYFNSVIISLIKRGAKDNIYFTPAAGSDAAIKKYASASDYAVYKAAQKYVYMSPLLGCAMTGNDKLMRYMVEESKVPYSRYDDNGAVVLAACKNYACMEVILDQGIDVNAATPVGLPLLFTAVSQKNYEMLEGLLERGADPNIKANGSTIYDVIKNYPKSRQNKILAIIEKYK